MKEINTQADQMMEMGCSQMKSAEDLKAENQLEWARKMESIHTRARETVLNDLIYTSLPPKGRLHKNRRPVFAEFRHFCGQYRFTFEGKYNIVS